MHTAATEVKPLTVISLVVGTKIITLEQGWLQPKGRAVIGVESILEIQRGQAFLKDDVAFDILKSRDGGQLVQNFFTVGLDGSVVP